MRWHVSGAYKTELGDEEQVYETTVDADDAEQAEREAQSECRESNGFDDTEPLVDVYARPVLPIELADEIREALEGDSNDDEHDALVAVAQHFGIEYVPDFAGEMFQHDAEIAPAPGGFFRVTLNGRPVLTDTGYEDHVSVKHAKAALRKVMFTRYGLVPAEENA